MAFNLQGFVLNPFAIIALTIVMGAYFGNLNFRGFKLGSSGSLFAGLALGYVIFSIWVSPYQALPVVPEAASKVLVQGLVPKSLFTLSLIGFIAPVGLMASADIADVLKRYGMRFVLLGIAITMAGAFSSMLFIKGIGKAQGIGIVGTYVGALTSSPGLAAALEAVADSGGNREALVGLGYAVGYIPGVLMVVIGMRLLPKWLKIDLEEERQCLRRQSSTETYRSQASLNLKASKASVFNVSLFMKICLAGVALGQVKVNFGSYLGSIGLGTTGGVLVASLVIGQHLAKKAEGLPFSVNALKAIRDISLNMFLAIVGLRYGYSTITSILSDGLIYLVAALISGSVSVITGIILGRYVMKMNWIILAGALCGGMTSTPGLAAALESCEADEVAASYGATYPIALISMILFTTIMAHMV